MTDENLVDESFKITNDGAADWAIRTIADEYTERDRLIKIARDRIEELEQDIATINIQYENKTKYLKSCLNEYFQTVKHKETKTQESYKLLSGSLVLKKESQKIIKNDEELVNYLEKEGLDEFVKISKSPDWAGFKKLVKIIDNNVVDSETGEIVPALKVEDVPASFDIKFY